LSLEPKHLNYNFFFKKKEFFTKLIILHVRYFTTIVKEGVARLLKSSSLELEAYVLPSASATATHSYFRYDFLPLISVTLYIYIFYLFRRIILSFNNYIVDFHFLIQFLFFSFWVRSSLQS